MSSFSDSRFQTTCWTQVLSAKGDSVAAIEALETLCDSYYEPVIVYLVKAGYDRDGTARDLAHDFFSDLLKGGRMEQLDRERGRFRSYLLGALKHFLSHSRVKGMAIKRGGDREHLSLNETGGDVVESQFLVDQYSLPPDAWFDRQWAMALLARALASVEQEFQAAGNAAQFSILKPWLMGESEHGDQIELAQKAGLSPSAVKSTIHRLRKRFRHAVKNEISQTIASPEHVDEEMQALFAALRNTGGNN